MAWIVGQIVLVGLVAIIAGWHIIPSRRKSAAIQTPDARSWITYMTRPEQYGLVDISPEARAVQGDRYWRPGSFGFQR